MGMALLNNIQNPAQPVIELLKVWPDTNSWLRIFIERQPCTIRRCITSGNEGHAAAATI